MNLEYPWCLTFALPAAFAAWRLLRRGRKSGVRFSAVALLPRGRTWRTALAAAAPWLASAALVLLAVAAAGPRTPHAQDHRQVDAIAIVMAVDVSGSMSTLDLTPPGTRYSHDTTRLAAVKKVFADFVARRPDDLIGLVAFGTYASARSPLTADHDSLLKVLEGVEIPEGHNEAETAIGDGLSVALLRIKDAKPKSKVVILLSDGMSNNGVVAPDEAAEMASRLGVKVYTIGVGTRTGLAPRLLRDAFGREIVRNVPSGFDEAQLRDIARRTKGRYFRVNDRKALDSAMEEIDRMERTEIESVVWNRWNRHFAPFAASGALLAFVAALFSALSLRRMA